MRPRPAARRPSGVLVMAGVCHLHAPLDLRQECALDDGRALLALRAIREGGVAREALALSTCNRVELYAAGTDARALRERLCAVLGAGTLTRVREGREVAHHMLRVASGLESRVAGDDGIRGQLRDAATLAREDGASGIVLNRLVDAALDCGRRVRRDRPAPPGPSSVARVAVALAVSRAGPLAGRAALVLGGGRVGREASRALAEAGAAVVTAGRRETGDPVVLTRLLAAAEIVVTATSAPGPVVSRAALARALRPGDPGTLVLDLAVPRDVDPSAASLPGLTLLDVDAITAGARAGVAAGADAGLVALRAAADWERWWRQAAAGPAIAAMRADEEERLRIRVARLPAAERERAWRDGRRALGALLHARTLEMRARFSPA